MHVKDRQIIQKVLKEWRCGPGVVGMVVPTALDILQRLEQTYGDKVTVDGACDALKRLSQVALEIRDNLKAVKAARG